MEKALPAIPAKRYFTIGEVSELCGVKPYVRATTNPDADSWVAEFIAWWIDPDTGIPIPERAGVLRYFVRVNDAILWDDSPEELRKRFGADVEPKSVTFIAAKLGDNQALVKADSDNPIEHGGLSGSG